MNQLTLPAEFQRPDYDGGSIANVPGTIASLFGAQLSALPSTPDSFFRSLGGDIQRVVLLIIDGWGWNLFNKERPELQNFLDQAAVIDKLTSIFPSTTVAALSSLWTGAAPAQHGMVGLSMFFPEYGTIGQMLRLTPEAVYYPDGLVGAGLQPETFLQWPGFAQQLAESGIATHRFKGRNIVDSALSRMLGRGTAGSYGIVTLTEMLVQMRRLLESRTSEPLFVAGYWPTIDTLSHDHGWDHEIVAAELHAIIAQVQLELLDRLPEPARRGTALLLVADHGQVVTPYQDAVYLEDHPQLQQMLMMIPAGEPRALLLHAKHGQQDAVIGYINERLGQAMAAWPSATALAAGLLGPPPFAHSTPDRIGDVVAALRGGHAFLNTRAKDAQRAMSWNGRHGSLTQDEMLVPWLGFRLDAI